MRRAFFIAGVGRAAVAIALAAAAAAPAQSATTVSLPGPLLPGAFGAWKTTVSPGPAAAEPAMSLANANKAALEECGPQRSQVADYANGTRRLHVEAIQFGDYTGAWSAFTLLRAPGLKDMKELGSNTAVGDGAVLFTSGATLAVAFPATAADVGALKPLADALPRIGGNAAQPPMLPLFLPARGLATGSVRYALGAATYAAEGGALPAAGLGWNQSAEAITAQYEDKRGSETLTLLLYPTPQIATSHLKAIEAIMPGMGPKFAGAKARREAELVMVADGTFSPDAAQQMIDGIHMRQQAAVDRAMSSEAQEHVQVVQTVSLLTEIVIFVVLLFLAAVVLALFLGGGRALIRVMRGQPAATEPEFLSLHLAPQNAPVRFEGKDGR